MSVLGIVAEYNPFHNGHKYHIEQSKKLCGAGSVVCVMSGNFIQRGEPAIVDKWARTEMALMSGADLVIELPVVYAMASAEFFAYGAVKIMDSLGILDFICFGSEAGSTNELNNIADILNEEPENYKVSLRSWLSKGLSFPAARENALLEYLDASGNNSADIGIMVGSPNNILAIEYLKALKKIGSKIRPQTIKRIANEYNSEELAGSISSATSIRKQVMLHRNSSGSFPASKSIFSDLLSFSDSLAGALPAECLEIMKREFQAGRGPVFSQDFENTILSALRQMSIEKLSKLPYIAEGLENRIKCAADNSGSLDELLGNISTRRYTRTRIQRCLFHIFTGLTCEDFMEFNLHGGPQYIRVLGFNSNGRQLLSEINRKASLPVIVKTADFKSSCNPLLVRMLEIEAASTDQYALSFSNPKFKKSGQEFTRNPIISKSATDLRK